MDRAGRVTGRPAQCTKYLDALEDVTRAIQAWATPALASYLDKLAPSAPKVGERDYLSTLNDTTVAALTQTPALTDGKLVWQDSPLVRAITHGRALSSRRRG